MNPVHSSSPDPAPGTAARGSRIVTGVDFGTRSVRVSIVDDARGVLGSCAQSYRVITDPSNPDHASQRHEEHMDSLAKAFCGAIANARIAGDDVESLALATTGSTIVPLDEKMQPLDDYYLWCDHRAKDEAAEITEVAHRVGWKGIEWANGVFSPEWGLAKILHWLRRNPEKRERFAAVVEHSDMAVATLCGIADVAEIPRNACAMGHKWLCQPAQGGMPPREFLSALDPLLENIADKLRGPCKTSDHVAGHLCKEWADRLGLRAGIPIPFASIDTHWDTVAVGIAPGDVVNIIGTSSCLVAVTEKPGPIPGVFNMARGSVLPSLATIEAGGIPAAGDLFDAIARRAGKTVAEMSRAVAGHKPGQSGLIRLPWDNGDRSPFVKQVPGGVTLGWTLRSTAEDEFHAAVEGMAFHTRIILDGLAARGIPVNRVIHGGGIPRKDDVLNRIFANVLGKPVLVAETDTTGLGAAIFAFRAINRFDSIEAAQKAICPKHRVFTPEPEAVAAYEKHFRHFEKIYHALGNSPLCAQ